MENMNRPDLSIFGKNWPAPYVAREEVKRFSGGILHPKTMANHDSNGSGPEVRLRVGRKVMYETKSLISWMENRTKVVK